MTATVFSNDMTAHVWAQVRQPSGRSNNGNLYFDGRTLFSYGNHFPVGYIDHAGAAWLNSDSYSVSTSRHQSDARSAVSHRTRYNVPALGDLLPTLKMIESDGQIARNHRGKDSAVVRRAIKYLETHWRAFPETGNDSAAIHILYAIGSRASWCNMRKGLERAAKRAADDKASAERKAHIEHGRALSRQSMGEVRALAWIAARGYQHHELREMIRDAAKAHKATPAKLVKQRAAVWVRLKAMRAILELCDTLSDYRGNPSPRLKAHAALATLRRMAGGQMDSADGAKALDAPEGRGWRCLAENLAAILNADSVHMPPAMRRAASERLVLAERTASHFEGEAARLARIAAARRPVLGCLRELRMLRRERAAMAERLARGEADPFPPTAESRIRNLQDMTRTLEVLQGWSRGDYYQASGAPGIVARVARLAPTLSALATEIAAELGPLVAARDAAWEDRKAREQEERERVAAMTPEELAHAWTRGEVSDASVRRLPYPVLRAVAPVVEGCNVTEGTLETSQGATVPLRHAFRVFQFVAACRAAGKGWQPGASGKPKTIRVGHFTVDSVAPDGSFVAGCHSLRWPEIAALASALGVSECLASPAEIAAELEAA